MKDEKTEFEIIEAENGWYMIHEVGNNWKSISGYYTEQVFYVDK